MPITVLIPIIILLLTIALGLLLVFNVRRTKTNLSFTLIVFAVAFWVFSNLMVDLSVEESAVLFWSKMTIIGPSFVPGLLVFFSYHFPRERRKISFLQSVLFFAPSFILLLFAPTKWNIQSVRLVLRAPPEVFPGPLYIFLFFYFIIYLGFAFLNFFKNYKTSNLIEKLQIKYIFTGAIISALIGLLTNLVLLLMGVYEAASLGPSSIIFFIVITSYAILKHHLFEIKVILVELLVAIIAFILVTQALMSEVFWTRILNWGVLFLFCIFGYYLIKATIQEIQRREQIERMSKDLQKAYKQLKKLDIAKSEFISIASHQLRTPLTAIKGYTSLIEDKAYGVFPLKMQKPLKNIYSSVERLIGLVNDLLSISRIEAGKIKVEPEEFLLENLIDNILGELRNLAKAKNLYLKWEKSKKPSIKAFMDKAKMRQVILNIIDNAIKYTQTGGITINYKQDKGLCKIEIKDTGEGMTRAEISNLFKTFSRGIAGQRNWTEGAGLGLYIAKKFTEMHNGRIWVKSAGEKKGSTFYIEMPIRYEQKIQLQKENPYN